MSIANNLPDPPSGYNHYILVFETNHIGEHSYRLMMWNGDHTGVQYDPGTTILQTPRHWNAYLSDGQWSTPEIGNVSTDNLSLSPDGQNYIIAANFNICDSSGNVLKYATNSFFSKRYIAMIGDTITAADLAKTVSGCVKLVPLVLPVVIGFFAFRKAWTFCKTIIKGA